MPGASILRLASGGGRGILVLKHIKGVRSVRVRLTCALMAVAAAERSTSKVPVAALLFYSCCC